MPRSEEFREQFGFDHDCECTEQIAAGLFVSVTPCYTGLCDAAMARCEESKDEVRAERAANAQLRIQLKELGVEPRV